MIPRFCLSFVFALALSATAVTAGGILTVVGTGQVAAVPDMASVSVGVEVEAPTADRALRLNSARMAEIIATLKEHGIKVRDIQTSQFSLHPQWSNRGSSSSKPPKINGFAATNVVNVQVRQLDRLGNVLDGLTKSGANRIQGVQFSLSNPGPEQDKARKRAVAEALRKAALYADAAGLTLGPVLMLSEGSGGGQPVYRMEARAMSDAVPIAEGELILRAEVTMQFATE